MDGIWIIETEKATDWETALRIDRDVWIRMLKIIIRRIMKYLNLEEHSLKNLVEALTFRWSVEGWDYEILKNEEKEAKIKINKCPYKEIMLRNPERHDKIQYICNDVCKPFYAAIINDFNPDIEVIRSKYGGLGDEYCDFQLKI